MGKPGGLVEEDVLHDQAAEVAQRRSQGLFFGQQISLQMCQAAQALPKKPPLFGYTGDIRGVPQQGIVDLELTQRRLIGLQRLDDELLICGLQGDLLIRG